MSNPWMHLTDAERDRLDAAVQAYDDGDDAAFEAFAEVSDYADETFADVPPIAVAHDWHTTSQPDALSPRKEQAPAATDIKVKFRNRLKTRIGVQKLDA